MLPPQRREPLLLGVRVDISANDKRHNVKERNPSLLWEELLRKRKADWRSDPADLHYWPESGTNGRPDLMEGACTSNDGHENQIHRVLDWRDLGK